MKIHIRFDDNTDDNTEPYIEFESAEEEEYDLFVDEQLNIPEEKTSDWFATQREIYEQEEKCMSNTEREELVQRLKAMAEEEVLPPEERPMGAMCYRPAAPNTIYTFTCPRCGRIIKEFDYKSRGDLHRIASMVEEMKQLGYDVKTERVCSVCSGRSGRHPLKVDTLFYFRYKGMEAYHVAIANYPSNYKVVLSFLRSENAYYGDRDDLKYVSEQRDIIEEMLGIKL